MSESKPCHDKQRTIEDVIREARMDVLISQILDKDNTPRWVLVEQNIDMYAEEIRGLL